MGLFPLWEILRIVRRTEDKVDLLTEKVDALDAFVREQFTPQPPLAERAGDPVISASVIKEPQ